MARTRQRPGAAASENEISPTETFQSSSDRSQTDTGPRKRFAQGPPTDGVAPETPQPSSKKPPRPDPTSLLSFQDLLPHAQDNHYIQTGYRHPSTSLSDSFASLLYLHNESINILTHAAGAVFFLFCGGLYLVTSRLDPATPSLTAFLDLVSLALFFTSATICLGCSATFHTMTSRHEKEVVLAWNRLDYAGIILLTWGSYVPSLRFGFRGNMVLMVAYTLMITIIAVGCLVVVLGREYATPKYRTTRTCAFAGLGLSGVIPVIHGVGVYGFETMRRRIGLDYMLIEAACYLSGAALYAARIPEKYRPGKHDLVGSSHQIFHVLVVMAAYSHMIGVKQAWQFEHGLTV